MSNLTITQRLPFPILSPSIIALYVDTVFLREKEREREREREP